MRQRYTYEIETTHDGTTWRRTARDSDTFSRTAPAVARALLETWVIDHPGKLDGGERIVVHDPVHHPHDDEHERIAPTVRVRIYAGDNGAAEPIAIGYLGHDERDFQTLQQPVLARIRRTVNEHRVETGVAAAVTVGLGIFVTRLLRRRRSDKPGGPEESA